MKIKTGWAFAALVTALLALAATSVAVGGKIKVKSTAQQSADWFQWQEAYYPGYSFGEDCALGQLGEIWYLGGTGGGYAERECDAPVPAGKQMFFPLVNAVFFNEPGEDYSVYEKRVALDDLFSDADGDPLNACHLTAMLDGEPVIFGGTSIERVQSPPFEYAGDPEAIADSYWVLLPKLPLGGHTIEFTGDLCYEGAPVFSVDVTYTLTIVE